MRGITTHSFSGRTGKLSKGITVDFGLLIQGREDDPVRSLAEEFHLPIAGHAAVEHLQRLHHLLLRVHDDDEASAERPRSTTGANL